MSEAESTLSPEEFAALEHWSIYGRRGSPPEERVEPVQEKLDQFESPKSAAWDLSLRPNQLSVLLRGFSPSAMEDKWLVYAIGPGHQGLATVHMHRSWTGMKAIQLHLKCEPSGFGQQAELSAKITQIKWNKDLTYTLDSAKETALEVCRWVLGVEIAEVESSLPDDTVQPESPSSDLASSPPRSPGLHPQIEQQ